MSSVTSIDIDRLRTATDALTTAREQHSQIFETMIPRITFILRQRGIPFDSFEFRSMGDTSMTIETSHWCCGDEDRDERDIPLEYLLVSKSDDDIKALIEAERTARERLRELEAAGRARAAQEAAEVKERAEYERLRQKFESDTHAGVRLVD